MAPIHCAPLFAAFLLLIPAALAQSVPSAAVGQAILDQPLVGDVALPVLGGQLTNGVDMVFANSGDKAPNTLNTGVVSIGFTTATVLPIGGQVIVTLPKGYFAAVDSSKINSFVGTSTTCKCSLASGTNTDSVNCVTSGAALAVGAATLNFASGAITTGSPSAVSSYNVQTSVDRALASGPATKAIGGVISALQTISFTATADKVPLTVNTASVKIGFTVATTIPIGGKVTIILPKNYFAAVSNAAINTFESSKVTASCSLIRATGTSTKDNIVCTTAGDSLSASAHILNFIAGAVTTGSPTAAGTYTVRTSTDLESSNAATEQLGGSVSAQIISIVAADALPQTTNSNPISFNFTTVTDIPSGGTVTIALPPKYFSAVDASKTNTFLSSATAKCTLITGTSGTSVLGITDADSVVCTTSGSTLTAGSQMLTFVSNGVTTGIAQAQSPFNIATSVDAPNSGAAVNTQTIGGQLSDVSIAFTAGSDMIPGTLNSNNVTFAFKTAKALPTNGKITLALPSGYFSFIDSNAANILSSGGLAKCVLTVGSTGVSVLGIPDADTVICTVAGTGLSASTSSFLVFMAGSVRTGTPQGSKSFNAATSMDIQASTIPSTSPLGGTLSSASLTFSSNSDSVPFKTNANTVTITVTTSNPIPVGGKLYLSFPRGYISKVDESKINTISTATCTCSLTQATGVATQDTITCTTAGAIVNGSVSLGFIAGAVTTGAATAAGTFEISTTVDRKLTGAATVALGGQLTSAVALSFSNADDRIPGKFLTTNGTITLGFSVVNAIPIGGKITITLPQGYFAKVDASKENTVGSSTTAKCSLANVAQTSVSVSISSATTSAGATSMLTINLIASVVTGLTQLAIPLAGFSLDASSVASCILNCVSSSIKASITNSVLTLTLSDSSLSNSIILKNTLTTFTITLVTNPSALGWPTTGITGVAFNPSTTVICTTGGSIVAATAQTFTFVSGSVSIGSGQKASTFQVETSTDLPFATPGATVSLGGSLTVGRPLAFANPQDQVPGQVNSGPISLGATLANSVPIGGQFLLTFPTNYFTNVNPASVVTLTRGARRNLLQQSTLSCLRIAGTPADQIVCTLAGAASGTGAVVLTFPPGSLTTGLPIFLPGGPTGFNIATANPPAPVTRVPYFPKAAAAFNGVALLLAFFALLALL